MPQVQSNSPHLLAGLGQAGSAEAGEHCPRMVPQPRRGRTDSPIRATDLLVTELLATRPPKPANVAAEAAAFYELATLMLDSPERAIQRFMELALELCDAGSAGLSVLDRSGRRQRNFSLGCPGGAIRIPRRRNHTLGISALAVCASTRRPPSSSRTRHGYSPISNRSTLRSSKLSSSRFMTLAASRWRRSGL